MPIRRSTFYPAQRQAFSKAGLVALHAPVLGRNLLPQSETFDASSWTKTRTRAFGSGSVVNAIANPVNGAVTADLLVEDNTAGNSHYVSGSQLLPSGVYTFSVYAKAAGRSWLYLFMNPDVRGAYFDLANGVVGSTTGGASRNIVSLGGGWYRCWITATMTNPAYYNVFMAEADNDYTYDGDNASGVYLFGAMLNEGVTPLEYEKTTDLQRIRNLKYTGKNLLWRTEELSNAVWTKTRASITPDAVANPLTGAQDADKLVEDSTAANTHTANQVIANSLIADDTTVVASSYVRPDTRTHVALVIATKAGVNKIAYYHLHDAGATSGVSAGYVATIEAVNANWWRISISGSVGAGASNPNVAVFLADTSPTWAYNGDGISGLYVWGLQLEEGSEATSYETSQFSFHRGATTAAEASDPALVGAGLLFATDDYALAGNDVAQAMNAPFAKLMAGKFNGTVGSIWSMAATGAADQYIRVAYNGANKVMIAAKAGGAETTSADLAIDGGAHLVLALESDGDTLTLTNLATGASVTLANPDPAGTARCCLGATGGSAVANIVDAMTICADMRFNKRIGAVNTQKARRYLRGICGTKGVTLS